jgi:hypothetical protein
MAIETSENEHGGLSYSVHWDKDLSQMPDEIFQIVDEFDRRIFRDPDSFFTSLLERCEHEAMSHWLDSLAEGGFLQLAIHTADVGPKGSVKLRVVYFDFLVGDSGTVNSLQFRKEEPEGLIHQALRPVFELIECVNPAPWGLAGGQLSYEPGTGGLFCNMGWMKPSAEIDADHCQQLYYSADGNVIGCHADGSAIWCDHGRMERLGPIEAFLNLYFQRLTNQSGIANSHDLVAALKG